MTWKLAIVPARKDVAKEAIAFLLNLTQTLGRNGKNRGISTQFSIWQCWPKNSMSNAKASQAI
jgi:hypothetical protein